MKPQSQSPRIYDFQSYRSYLKASYSHLKATQPRFSLGTFARAAGYKSPSFLKLVIDGKRNLTADGVQRFSKALKLGDHEQKTFSLLVSIDQARSDSERAELLRRLERCHKEAPDLHTQTQIQDAQLDYFRKWYFVVIRELIAAGAPYSTPEDLARILAPHISSEDAQSALNTLTTLGFIQRRADGTWIQISKQIGTGIEVPRTVLADYHRRMIALGSESIARIPREERQVLATTVALGPEAMKLVKEKMVEFCREVLLLAEEYPSTGDNRVIQVNLQAFPVTKGFKKCG